MVIRSTSAVEVSIHAVSPVFSMGAGAAVASAGAASAGLASAASAAGAASVAADGSAAGAGSPCAKAVPLMITNAAAPATIILPNHFVMSFIVVVLVDRYALRSERVVVGFAGADADDLIHRGDEDLS